MFANYEYLHGAVDDFSGKMFGQFSSTGTKTQMKNFEEKVIKKNKLNIFELMVEERIRASNIL